MDDLNNDNNKNIIFDPKLDDTRYDILTDLQETISKLNKRKTNRSFNEKCWIR